MKEEFCAGALRGAGWTSWGVRRLGAVALAAGLCLLAAGCGQQAINKQVKALADATPPVVTQATAAYETANTIHNQREDYDAVDRFNAGDTAYYARVKPLLTEQQVAVRLAVLKGLQTYVQELTAISNGVDSPALASSSKGLGDSLTNLANQQGPILETGLGLATATETTTTTVTTVSGGTTTSATSSATAPVPPVSADMQAGLGKGIHALGEFLAYRIEKKELPAKVNAMDDSMKDLCGKLSKEADYLADLEEKDLDSLIIRQRQFLTSDAKIDPAIKRNEIEKMPQWQRQETAGHEQLVELKAALADLYLKHHALAVELNGGNPEGLKGKLSDLAAAGMTLAK